MDTWDPGEYEYIFLEGPSGDLRGLLRASARWPLPGEPSETIAHGLGRLLLRPIMTGRVNRNGSSYELAVVFFGFPDNPYSAMNHSSTEFCLGPLGTRWLWWTPGAAGLAGLARTKQR